MCSFISHFNWLDLCLYEKMLAIIQAKAFVGSAASHGNAWDEQKVNAIENWDECRFVQKIFRWEIVWKLNILPTKKRENSDELPSPRMLWCRLSSAELESLHGNSFLGLPNASVLTLVVQPKLYRFTDFRHPLLFVMCIIIIIIIWRKLTACVCVIYMNINE